MGGRPPKSYLQLAAEGTSKQGKKEMENRRKGEEALTTQKKMQESPETKADPVAHKLFTRLRKLLNEINQGDAIHDAVINRYCQITGECARLVADRSQLTIMLDDLDDQRRNGDIEFEDYLENRTKLYAQWLKADQRVMDKYKLMLAIERENLMTIQSKLRSVPKQLEKKQAESPMAAFLNKKHGT